MRKIGGESVESIMINNVDIIERQPVFDRKTFGLQQR